jgi:two-component system, cell cycle response regulator DivK
MSRILLVEDNEQSRDLLSRRLESRGFVVSFAVDGRAGIEKAQSELPDLILMGLNLPQKDGWEATAALRSYECTRHIPVIGLAAHAIVPDRTKVIDAGCDDFASKPIEFPNLFDKIDSLLRRSRN